MPVTPALERRQKKQEFQVNLVYKADLGLTWDKREKEKREGQKGREKNGKEGRRERKGEGGRKGERKKNKGGRRQL